MVTTRILPFSSRWAWPSADGIAAVSLAVTAAPAQASESESAGAARNEGKTLSGFLATDFRVGDDPNAKGDVFAEYEAFFDPGIEGLFTDHPDTAVAARDQYYDEETSARTSV